MQMARSEHLQNKLILSYCFADFFSVSYSSLTATIEWFLF